MNKSALKSKTFWFGIITAIAPLVPKAGQFIAENSASIGMVWGAMTIILRMITKEKVVLLD
jgi:hypothetical protein